MVLDVYDGRSGLSVCFAPLVAQNSAWQHMGRRFREGGNSLDMGELLILAGVLMGLFVLLWLVAKFLQRDPRPPYRNSRALFRQLCRAHRLSWRQRSLLWKLACERDLPEPASLFVMADCFAAAHLPPLLDHRHEELAALREKLFGEKHN